MIEVRYIGAEPDSLKHLEPPNEKFLQKLLLIVRWPKLHVDIRRGYPTCDLCGYSVAGQILKGGAYPESVISANVIVPWKGGFFLFPTLLHHYCKMHDLQIPAALIRAAEELEPDSANEQAMKKQFEKLLSG